MCWIPLIKRRARRRTVLAFWAPPLTLFLLLWLYVSSGPGYRTGQTTTLPGPLRPGSEDGGLAPDWGHDDTNARTARSTAMGTSTKPAGAAATIPAEAPTVVLRQGTYVGTTLLASPRFPKSIDAFRGVPYAQDTGGENRFRPPQPLPASAEIFDAVAWGKVCPCDGVVQRNMSENCLNANIYRPAGLVDKNGFEKDENGQSTRKRPKLPVVVYVHGGGFNKGHGTERNMASFLAWAEGPMVAVNFNYRVGALGFLPSDVTAREGLLNLGLRDQQALFEWVQDNIEAFGGDPKKVTLMGLSAGAHSIGHHIMYYSKSSGKAPFIRAILESGATTARAVFYPTHPRHLIQFREFLIAAGAAGVPESDIFPTLRTLPLQNIVKASKIVWDKYEDNVTWPFQPVIDGPNDLANSSHADATLPPLIPDLPINLWLSKSHLRIPIITGYNTNEGASFVPTNANTAADFRAFFQALIPSLTSSDLHQLEEFYPDPVTRPKNNPYKKVPRGMGKQWARLDAAYSHYAYICPVLQTAHYMSQAHPRLGGSGGGGGWLGSSKAPSVYVYRYAATAAHGKAYHADEAAVVAHDMEELMHKPGLEAVAGEMHGAFARFAASLVSSSPNGDGGEGGKGVEWPAFVSPFGAAHGEEGAGKVMVFGEGNDERGGGMNKGTPAKVEELSELEREACRFWWERVGLSEGFGRREEQKAGARL
ncbi:hypothetical protein VTI74DRAFT_5522 [Chaetomium olivicolor]